VAMATMVMTLLVLIFAEVLPKTYAITNSERAAAAVAPLISLVVTIFAPVVGAVRLLVRAMLRLIGVKIDPDSKILAVREEIAGAIQLGHSEGVVEKEDIIDGSKVAEGDALIALASSGPRSNGYSLIRKIIEVSGADLNQDFNGKPLAETLLEPTRIYVKSVLSLIEKFPVHAISHITGGGLLENIPRVLPDNLAAQLDTNSWVLPEIFQFLQDNGNIDIMEMYRVFNCGVGMVIIVPAEQSQQAIAHLNDLGENAWLVGSITHNNGNQVII
ncbi:MAG: DUF21 domain-containing protein, partial [Gammaproteobacteria bacterium]|nr:DUF21 domain-containing protein [Gammaproteobacteria bacterium]